MLVYDHSDKIGNEGDVVKHAVLCRLIEELLDQTSGDDFIYAESHTGRAVYTLPETGRWLNGIKPFSENLLDLEGEAAANPTLPLHRNLDAYRRICFPEKAKAGSKYYGSSGIVREMLEEADISFQLKLWDSNPDVVRSLSQTYSDDPNSAVFEGDGYLGLQSVERASAALIDPISVKDDKTSILNTMSHLAERGIPFLCWAPLFGKEEPIFDVFEREARERYATVRLTWPLIEGTTWGCQVTVPIEYKEVLEGTCKDVCEVMKTERWVLHSSTKEQSAK